ncbi:MAG: chromosomal replication initiator protein DnaA [Myxococcota bacterium]|nr:chromosomal replication initiator protein DnaA [Myxococcota bacterium]
MTCPPEFWDGVLRRLGTDTPSFALNAWLRPLAVEQDGSVLRLLCPTSFHRERVRERFLPHIARSVAEEAGREVDIELCVAGSRAGRRKKPADPTRCIEGETAPRPVPRSVSATRPRLDRAPRGGVETVTTVPRPAASSEAAPVVDHSFASFVVGPCNALAREASYALAQGAQAGLGALYLSSAPGNGKTHLARALVGEVRRAGNRRVIYESAEAFTNRFMAALRGRSMEQFKRRYRRGCDLLVLEDLQFVASKKATQLELFHTLVHLADAGRRVVLTGDRLPRDIDGLDPRLRSQVTAGLVAEMEPPDAAVRREILRSKAAAGGVRLPQESIDLLVDSVRGSVRDLEGALIQLVATASLLKRPIDAELTRMALRKLAPHQEPARRLDIDAVLDVVTGFFGATRDALASRSRRRDVLVPRQLGMYLCRRYTDEPLTRIAAAFGRDHPSVSNAVKVVERRILERAPLRYQVEELSSRLDRLRDERSPER